MLSRFSHAAWPFGQLGFTRLAYERRRSLALP